MSDQKIKYSIVMTAFNRNQQLINTLDSFNLRGYSGNLEVIIVDDASEVPVAVDQANYDFQITVIRSRIDDKWYRNPCIPFNRGLSIARGEIVIIQNAECYHLSNVLNWLDQNQQALDDRYIAFSCYSLDEKITKTNKFEGFEKYVNIIPQFDGDNGWYNHSVYRPVGYHFCAAIKNQNLRQLKYFDESFAAGIGYDDDEILFRIKKFLKVDIVDDVVVLHQWHYTNPQRNQALLLRNRLLFKLYTKRNLNPNFVINFCYPFYYFSMRLRSFFK
jgi:hypothetical protein